MKHLSTYMVSYYLHYFLFFVSTMKNEDQISRCNRKEFGSHIFDFFSLPPLVENLRTWVRKAQNRIRSKLKVAVIQMKCNDKGDVEANISALSDMIDLECEKSTEKPELFLGPEFAIFGYTFDYERAWKLAECQGGRTETHWLGCSQAIVIFFFNLFRDHWQM